MKRTTRFLLTLLLAVMASSMALAVTTQSYAQTSATGNVLSFDVFGFNSETLTGPYDEANYSIYLPANWELQPGAQLELDLNVSASALDALGTPVPPQGEIIVTFNSVQLETIPLSENGLRSITMDIPNEALLLPETGRYSLSVRLDSGTDCTISSDTTVIVDNSSALTLPHRFVAPPTDLTIFPRPFYQRSFEPDQALVVIPAEPSLAELQAAYTVMAGFGNLTNGRVALQLITADQLPESLRLYKNLIFVSRLDGFPEIEEVEFAVPLTPDGFRAAGSAVGDGLIQTAVSPWNSEGVVLMISGEDDEAIVKAARALSTGNLQVSRRRNVAVVADVQPNRAVGVVATEQRTFAQLGYGEQLLSGVVPDQLFFQFSIPFGFTPKTDGEIYLDLSYLHAAILDYGRSGLIVRLNENLIGSILFTEESTRITQTRIPIPASALRSGVNEILIESTLVPQSICSAQQPDDIWVAIRPESTLSIPLAETPINGYIIPELGLFTQPFSFDNTLGTTTLVIPRNEFAAWSIAGQLAYDLGDQANAPIVNLEVAFADDISPELRQGSHFLIVGRPSTLPIIEEINNNLPVSVVPGSDDLAESILPVTYRLPRNADLGYLELLPSPWDARFTVVTVLGRTDEGIQAAANALLDSSLRNRLSSNFATVVDTQVAALNTNLLDNLQAPAATQENTNTAVDTEATSPPITADGRPTWLYPAMIGTIYMMIAVVVIVVGLNVWKRVAPHRK